MFLVPSTPIFGDFFELFHNCVSVPLSKSPLKIKISMSYPPSTNNFEHPMPCSSCRTLEASFLEDLVPPSKLVCHIPLQLITLNTPRSVGPVMRGQFFRRPCFFVFFFWFQICDFSKCKTSINITAQCPFIHSWKKITS